MIWDFLRKFSSGRGTSRARRFLERLRHTHRCLSRRIRQELPPYENHQGSHRSLERYAFHRVRSVRNGIHCQGARYRGVHGCRMVCSCIHDNACHHQDNRGSTQICSSRAKGSFAGNGCKQVEDHIQGRDPCCHGRGAYRNNPFARSCSRRDGTDYVHCSGVHIFHPVCGHDIRACSRSAVSSVLPSNTERSSRDAVRYSDYPVAHRSVHVPARVCNQISLQQESQMVIVWNSNSKGRGWSKKWHPSNLP